MANASPVRPSCRYDFAAAVNCRETRLLCVSSTDEQKRKGYSLPEQEDRLLKYCEYNDIEVKGIYREDFSAENFNRPEWKKLMIAIKNKSSKEDSFYASALAGFWTCNFQYLQFLSGF
ncbi:recombinase family protein [Niabella aurantiaca]|uniref:recombinase family protein n=1 Tax=Niabella aurantiaca TaxID=379900 RepID=UPI000A03B73E|nr:recombinase family protein [Niabella aurantiaca]